MWRNLILDGNLATREERAHGVLYVFDLQDDRGTSSRSVCRALVHPACAQSEVFSDAVKPFGRFEIT